jgi:hypothetical protein
MINLSELHKLSALTETIKYDLSGVEKMLSVVENIELENKQEQTNTPTIFVENVSQLFSITEPVVGLNLIDGKFISSGAF